MAETNSITAIATNQNPTQASENNLVHLQNSDHLGTMLLSAPLTGRNYLSWSSSMILAQRTKGKFGFMDGSFPAPAVGSATSEKWNKVDSSDPKHK